MRSRKLETLLGTLHRGRPRTDVEFQSHLGARLARRHEELYGKRAAGRAESRRIRAPLGPIPLLAAVTAVIVIAVVGSIPVGLSMGVGKLITIHVPTSASDPPGVSELQRLVGSATGVDEMSVSVSRSSAGETTILLVLFGVGLDQDALASRLRSDYPALSDGRWEVEELQGEIRTSLARKLGRDWLSMEVSFADLEQARRDILQRLAARGLGDGTVVKLRKDGERKQIDVRMDGPGAP